MQAEDAISAGKYPDAARILVSIVEKDPQNWRAFNNMGLLSWYQKAWDDAYAMFSTSLKYKPDYMDALLNIFDAALKLRRAKEVLQYFENALAINPDLETAKIIRDSIIQQGQEIYFSARAIQIGMYSPLIEEANKRLEEGNYTKAMVKYLESNDTDGPSAEAYCGLGIVAYYQKKYEDAYILFIESLKINPSDPDTYLNLLDTAKECNRILDAMTVFTTNRTSFPEIESVAAAFENAAKSVK